MNKEQRIKLEEARLEVILARIEVYRFMVDGNYVSVEWAREHILGEGKILLS